MGRLGGGINLGVILGPLLASALSGIGPWAPPMVAAVLAFIDFVCAFFLMPETRHLRPPSDAPPPSRIESPWTAPVRWPVLSVLAMYCLLFLSITNIHAALAHLLSQRH